MTFRKEREREISDTLNRYGVYLGNDKNDLAVLLATIKLF